MLQLFLMKLTLNDFENDKTILFIIMKNQCYEKVYVLSN
ncbi:TPA: hypothetical protein ACSTPQ_000304 [Staphylococcus aureus]